MIYVKRRVNIPRWHDTPLRGHFRLEIIMFIIWKIYFLTIASDLTSVLRRYYNNKILCMYLLCMCVYVNKRWVTLNLHIINIFPVKNLEVSRHRTSYCDCNYMQFGFYGHSSPLFNYHRLKEEIISLRILRCLSWLVRLWFSLYTNGSL